MTAPVLPTSADELEEVLNEDRKIKEYFNEDGTPKPELREFIKAYAKAQQGPSTDVAAHVRELVQAEWRDFLKDNNIENVQLNRLNLSPSGRPQVGDQVATGRGAVYNRNAPGAAIDHLFNDLSEYLATIWHNNHSPDATAKKSTLRNDYGSTVPADGGFLIPERLRSQLLSVSLERSIVRPRAMVVPMDSARVPFPSIDTTSNASSVHGGIVGYWTEESADMTESQAKFSRVVLEANTLTAYCEVPNQLLQDSIISFAAFIAQKYPEALAWFEDIAHFSGSGAGEPVGFLNASAAVEVAKETGQEADTLVWENIVKMYSRMLPSSLGQAVWVCHIDTFPELATMALSVGTGGSAIWLNNGQDGPPMRILGRPAIFTEKAKTVGDAGDINFVDFGYYLIGDRQQMTAASSEHFKFKSNQTVYRVVQRVDGRPWIQSAITPQTGSNTLSPFVKLAARA